MRWLRGDVRAFVAAIRKQLRETRRYPMLLLGSLFWPILLPSMYVLMGQVYSGGGDPRALGAFAERSGISDVTGFVFVGFAMYMWLSIILWGPGTALRQEQMRGSLEAVFLTPASRLVVLFGPPLGTLWVILFQFLVMGLALWLLFGIVLDLAAVARAVVVLVFAVPALYAIGSLFAAAVLRYGEIGPAVHFVRGALVLACGITYPVVMLPGWAQAVAAALPPTYIVDDLRRVLLAGATLEGVAPDLAVIALLTVAFGAVAIGIYRWTEGYARRTGALGRY
ncbi:MAG: ABC transporter permease [Candidatus Limnocylindria bacterium]